MRSPVAALLFVLLSSCASARLVPAEAGSFRSPKMLAAAARVRVLQAGDAGQPTEVIGVIDVHEPTGSHDAALETLRQRAAFIGADAVLGVEFHHEDGAKKDGSHDIETHLSGLAVKMRPVLGDRPYKVIGPVKEDVDMEHENEGLDKLRAQAGELGADLLVDVQFHHGEGGSEKTLITGFAIKYL